MGKTGIELFKEILNIIIISLLGCAGIVFAVLYAGTFSEGFFAEYSGIITALAVGAITVLTVLTIIFFRLNKVFIYKILYIVVILVFCVLLLLYLLKVFGFFDKIRSVDEFRKYIESFGNFAIAMFILLQFWRQSSPRCCASFQANLRSSRR